MEAGRDSEQGHTLQRITGIVLRGTLLVSSLLALLLILYGISYDSLFRARTWVGLAVLVYIFTVEVLFRYKKFKTVNWMLIGFYEALAFLTLLQWGVNAPVGILTTSFVVILPSVLMGYKYILPVAISTLVMLAVVQVIHSLGLITPNYAALSVPSTFWDVATYSTILAVFALVSWLSGSQLERSLKRTQEAEASQRAQKDVLRAELERESSALRQAELRQVRHLHKFALIGQSTAATLHELSNHLSVLNLDIDDLRQQHSNSKAITNASSGVDHINKMVRQARWQLNSYDTPDAFNAVTTINQSIKDVQQKFRYRRVRLSKSVQGSGRFTIKGGQMALMQIVTILLNNALDACYDSSDPNVDVHISYDDSELVVRIHDNGPGIDPSHLRSLFKPHSSSKPSGLGIGLYIAHHLAKHQFNGSLQYEPPAQGAGFTLRIPKP